MMQKDLAAALDISPAMVSRLVKRGMPTDSPERAQKWRRAHLPMARMKGNRIDTAAASKPSSEAERSAAANASDDDQVTRVTRLMGLAAAALAAEQLALIEPELRDAMRRVPQRRRAACLLDSAVMDALTQEVAVAMRDNAEDASLDAAAVPEALNDSELDAMGAFWYRVAAGEIIVSAVA